VHDGRGALLAHDGVGGLVAHDAFVCLTVWIFRYRVGVN